jgi:hypothetical protein
MKADELKYLSDESLEKLDKDGHVWGASTVGAYAKEVDRLRKYVVLLEEIRD